MVSSPKSNGTRAAGIGLVLVLLVLAPAGAVRADLVKLKNGGEIRGMLNIRGDKLVQATELTVQTVTGGIIAIETAEVQFVTRRPLIQEEYEARRRLTPQTVEEQWALTEWCRSRNLRDEREAVLLAVIDLDPNHVAAHRALGHVQKDGEWTTRDEIMRADGYVKYKGRYVLPQELELIQRNELQLDAERGWFKKVHSWHDWLLSNNDARRLEAQQELLQINDASAVPALIKWFQNDPNEGLRLLFLASLANCPGEQAVQALVHQSLNDVSHVVRRKALGTIDADGRLIAIPLYVRGLKSPLNYVVIRSAGALAEIADAQVVPYLIDALITTHKYRVQITEQQPSYSSTGQGTVVIPPEIELMLRTGQLPYGFQYYDATPPPPTRVRTVTVKHQHQNNEVLEALQKMTGENFGFDQRTWRLWWGSEHKTAQPAKKTK